MESPLTDQQSEVSDAQSSVRVAASRRKSPQKSEAEHPEHCASLEPRQRGDGQIQSRGRPPRRDEPVSPGNDVSRSFAAIVRSELKRSVSVYGEGKKHSVTVLEAVLRDIIESSLRGDRHAQKMLLDTCAKVDLNARFIPSNPNTTDFYDLEALSAEEINTLFDILTKCSIKR